MLCVEVLELLLYSCLHEYCCCGRGGSSNCVERGSQGNDGVESVIYGAEEDGCPCKQIRNILVVSLCDGGIVAAAVSSSHTRPFAAKALAFPPSHVSPTCMLASETKVTQQPADAAVSPQPMQSSTQPLQIPGEREHPRRGPIESQHNGAQTIAALLASLYDEFFYALSEQPTLGRRFCCGDGMRCPIRCPQPREPKQGSAGPNGEEAQEEDEAKRNTARVEPYTLSDSALSGFLEPADELPVLVVSCDRDKAAVGPFFVREGELPPEEEAKRLAQLQRGKDARRRMDEHGEVERTGRGQSARTPAGEEGRGADFDAALSPGNSAGLSEGEVRGTCERKEGEGREGRLVEDTCISTGASEAPCGTISEQSAPTSLNASQTAAGNRDTSTRSCPGTELEQEVGVEVPLVLIVWGTEKAREGLLLQTYDRVRRLLSRKMVGLA
ncbi:transmembrane surface antigen TSA1 [Toxoplasma gondii CAST]|uniref:Transmembrane surface antigen TSA1 n=1 Tax=Toxoplasma gondii CAST TaxID=943122 RepID=A0A425I1J2_TOXGO|nr:transmembrane surface antigen TSA1 [Toxoplasma gondii CAST]